MDRRWLHYFRLAGSPPTNGLFIHDFVRVDLPFDAVVGAFASFVGPELVEELVIDAWRSETAEAGRVLAAPQASEATPASAGADEGRVDAYLGEARPRDGGLVIPIAWHATGRAWVPTLQADLELASFGPERTHLHILGLSHLPPGTVPRTERASLDHRLTVALVRHVLAELADLLVELAPGGPASPSTD